MMITRLLGIIAISVVMGGASTISIDDGPRMVRGPKNAVPTTYDYSVRWIYNASEGATELWGYTPNGGGIYELITWQQETTYWRSSSSLFYSSEFSFEIRLTRSALNDELFTPYDNTGRYLYSSPDFGIDYYNTSVYPYGFQVNVRLIDNDNFVCYTMDTSENGYQIFSPTVGPTFASRSYIQANDSFYHHVATWAVPSRAQYLPNNTTLDRLNTTLEGIYFDVVATANLELDEREEIEESAYNEGYHDGITTGSSEGYIDGYNDGIIDGMNNEGWADVFGIFDQAVAVVDNVFSISLFGPFTIGVLVAIPIVMGLLFWIVGKWRGA